MPTNKEEVVLEHTETTTTTEKTVDKETRPGFFQRHKTKLKYAGYTIGAGIVVGGGVYLYRRFRDAVAVVTE